MINKFIKTILSFVMVVSSLVILEAPIFKPLDVQADVTSLACGTQYEVAIANANGTFTKQACFNDFNSAQSSMWGYGDNAVVRHHASKSPMKIVAMVSGVAISYPMRSNSSTMNITQDVNHQYRKVTYVTKHREMKYESTYSYNGSGNGTIKVNITGFSGTADLVNVDLVPFIFTGSNVTVLLGGNDTTSANEQPFWTHIYQSHYEVRQNGANKELVFNAYSGWSSDTWPAVYSMTVGLAADWMNVGTVYYSFDGYNFYSDQKYTNKVGTYYNYYQFLPSRTASKIPASVFDNYLISVKGAGTNSKMKGQGQTFINAQNAYGINALLVYALACLESAYGTSNFALDRNNLFGWNAFDSNPGSASYFPSIEAAINEHMGINLRGYTDINDSRFFGSHVGNKGSGFNVKYAADPYWGYKIASIAYSIDKASGFTDYNKYSVGVINKYGVNILKSPNGAVLHNSAYGATYQENFTVAVLGNESGHYKLQTTNPLSGGNIIDGGTKGLVNYDWNNSVGYIPTGNISMVNTNTPPKPSGTEPTGDFVITTSNASISKEGKLIIEGNAYRPGIYVTDKNKVTQKLFIYDSMFNKTEVAVKSSVTDNDEVKYSVELDLTKMTKGDYYFKLLTEYAELPEYNQEYMLENLAVYPEEVTLNSVKYKLYDFEKIVKLSIGSSTSIPTPTPTPPTDIPKVLKHDITKFERIDNTLSIKGFAFITGINSDDTSNIQHDIYFKNLETGDIISFMTTTTSLDVPISMGDGYTYSKVGFEGTFDISNLPEGNYVLYVKVTNDSTEKRAEIINYYTNIKPSDTADVKFVLNTGFNFRYEMRLENSKVDYSVVKKPTINPSVFDFYTFNITDGILKVDAVAWMSGIDTIKSNNPAYKVLLVDQDGNVIENTTTNKVCAIDYGKTMKYKYSTNDACFDGSIDLTTLKNGTYTLLLDFSTSTNRDIIEMYDYYSRVNRTVTFNGKKYEIKTSPIRSRLILEISDDSLITKEEPTESPTESILDKPNEQLIDVVSPVSGEIAPQ